jgi:hypothetical protein
VSSINRPDTLTHDGALLSIKKDLAISGQTIHLLPDASQEMLPAPLALLDSCPSLKSHAICHRRWQKADAEIARRSPLLCGDILGHSLAVAD